MSTFKRGIALAGGGARGAYQIGALKALHKHGYLDDLHAISGVSVGSLNACLLAMGDLDIAEEIWLNLKEDSLFDKDTSWKDLLIKENVHLITDGIFKTDKLETIMDEVLDYDIIRKKQVFIAVSFVTEKKFKFTDALAINIKNFFEKEKRIKYHDLRELSDDDIRGTLLASCAIPVMFKPINIHGKTYYDGGILDNTPYTPLIQAGCDEVIVIDLFRISLRNVTRKKEIDGTKMKYIYPKKNLHGVMDFSTDHIKARFELGYHDALETIETWQKETET